MPKFLIATLALACPLIAHAACSNGQSEVSVEGAKGVFCVDGNYICMGDRADGKCPGPQTGLDLGSYCGKVKSGVYGCRVSDVSTSWTAGVGASTGPLVPGPFRCGNGLTAMSVEGVDLVFCVANPSCAANNSKGNCPGRQDGLQFGSYCDTVRTGVFGCKPYNSSDEKPNNVIYPPVPSCVGNSAGTTPVSVEGVGTFCATQPVCSGTIKGNCPVAQGSLEVHSLCAVIKTGVYGCVAPA